MGAQLGCYAIRMAVKDAETNRRAMAVLLEVTSTVLHST